MFHVKHEGWTAAELSLVSSQLSRPSKSPRVARDPRGMVASSDGDHLRERHVLDSLRAVLTS